MNEEIPSAENILINILSTVKIDNIDEIKEADPELIPYLIELINNRTKLHVEAALKAAAENADLLKTDVYKQTILNAYPLNLII